MSRENVELVRRMYDVYLSGDAEGALAYFHPDVEADFTVRIDTSIGHGREDLARIVATWVGTWDGYTEEVDDILDLGVMDEEGIGGPLRKAWRGRQQR